MWKKHMQKNATCGTILTISIAYYIEGPHQIRGQGGRRRGEERKEEVFFEKGKEKKGCLCMKLRRG